MGETYDPRFSSLSPKSAKLPLPLTRQQAWNQATCNTIFIFPILQHVMYVN